MWCRIAFAFTAVSVAGVAWALSEHGSARYIREHAFLLLVACLAAFVLGIVGWRKGEGPRVAIPATGLAVFVGWCTWSLLLEPFPPMFELDLGWDWNEMVPFRYYVDR